MNTDASTCIFAGDPGVGITQGVHVVGYKSFSEGSYPYCYVIVVHTTKSYPDNFTFTKCIAAEPLQMEKSTYNYNVREWTPKFYTRHEQTSIKDLSSGLYTYHDYKDTYYFDTGSGEKAFTFTSTDAPNRLEDAVTGMYRISSNGSGTAVFHSLRSSNDALSSSVAANGYLKFLRKG